MADENNKEFILFNEKVDPEVVIVSPSSTLEDCIEIFMNEHDVRDVRYILVDAMCVARIKIEL